MTYSSGIYLQFEGSSAFCDQYQLKREIVYEIDHYPSGALRYKDVLGRVHYFNPNSTYSWTRTTNTAYGWGTYTKNTLDYQSIGDTVMVNVAIAGSGNSSITSFSLPFQSDMDVICKVGACGSFGSDGNTTHYSDAVVNIASGSAQAYVQIFPSETYNGSMYGYTDAENKWLCGQFWYKKI